MRAVDPFEVRGRERVEELVLRLSDLALRSAEVVESFTCDQSNTVTNISEGLRAKYAEGTKGKTDHTPTLGRASRRDAS